MRTFLRLLAPVAASIAATASADTTAAGSIPLPGVRLHPESVSIAPDGTAYVGSTAGGVVRVSLRSGKAEQWITAGAYGTASIFGVLVDTRNRMLWVCSNNLSARGISLPNADAGAWFKGFDLDTREGKISLQLPGDRATCNDMTVARDGSLLVADTGASQVLRWHGGATTLAVWAQDPIFKSSQGDGLDGIAIGGDGNLYLNNVRSGEFYRIIVRANGSAGKITRLTTSRPLASPDGMRSIGGMDFVLVEGIGGGRIDRITVAGNHVQVRTLAENISEPTGVDSYGGKAWYVQGYLTFLFDPAKAGQMRDLPFRLTPVGLGK